MGNIIEVFENGRSAYRYEYDTLGRLTREDNVSFGKTTTWAYDNNGNIVAKWEYALTTKPTNKLHMLDGTCKLYTYADNSDMLMSHNGESFTYDLIGNPVTYRGKAATWAYGRQMTGYDGNTFAYDARGRRIAKNDITYTYDSNGNLIKQSNGLEFFYDHTGVFAVKYNGSTYFYRKNAQNDIISLLDNNGFVVVKYKYDAWGKCHTTVMDSTANTIAELNPFRYRSYYLDTETGLYFLKTRYYDPETGRFITIDDISYLDPESINGLNLYAYCGNNPVMCVDPNGTLKWYHWLGIIGAAIVVTAATILTCGAFGIAVGGAGLVGAVIHGAAVGALVGAGIGLAGGAIAGSIYSAITGADLLSSVFAGAMAGFGIGAIIGAVIGGTVGGLSFGSFSSSSSLNTHFVKHGKEFGDLYSNATEYAKGAKYVIRHGQKITYTYKGNLTTGYIKFFGSGGHANYAFVGLNGSKTATFGVRSVAYLVKDLGITIFSI